MVFGSRYWIKADPDIDPNGLRKSHIIVILCHCIIRVQYNTRNTVYGSYICLALAYFFSSVLDLVTV